MAASIPRMITTIMISMSVKALAVRFPVLVGRRFVSVANMAFPLALAAFYVCRVRARRPAADDAAGRLSQVNLGLGSLVGQGRFVEVLRRIVTGRIDLAGRRI